MVPRGGRDDRERYWSGTSWTQLYRDAPRSADVPRLDELPDSSLLGDLRRVDLRKLSPLLFVVAACLFIAFGTPGSWNVPWGHSTDTEDIHLAIESKLRDTADLPVDVECPSTVDWEPGNDFNCIATVDSGAKDEATLRIVVSMENNEGEYTFYAE